MTTASQTPESVYAERHRGTLAAATGVITAAMEAGALAPADIAQAELSAGILFDPQAAADIAAAASEQAHADDKAVLAERGEQLAVMVDLKRQLQRRFNAIMRLTEGRPGTHLLSVAEIAAAAEYGNTPLDHFPLMLAWTGQLQAPTPGAPHARAVVDCVSPHGSRVGVIVEDRLALASLLGAETRDVRAACPTKGCGGSHDFDPADMYGWARLEVPGVEDDRPRWYCSAACVSDALARAGEEFAAADRAAAVDPHAQAQGLPYGGLGDALDARYGAGASDEYAVQVAEATEAGFEDERGDAEGGV
ncbi:hypothetical protein [Streptomyces sp. NPDC020951]|uniref:hypothetical protein n=1 Tax=Streptomyces sp. NPDC020951 TaxID=3365104 RepID=UPI0037889C98